MPIYVYRCPACASRVDIFKRLADLDREEHCPHCPPDQAVLARQVTASFLAPDYPGYSCPVTGKWIEGRRAHEENLKRHNTRLVEPGETEAAAAFRAAEEARLDADVDETVETFVAGLDGDNRAALATALEDGAGVLIDRR